MSDWLQVLRKRSQGSLFLLEEKGWVKGWKEFGWTLCAHAHSLEASFFLLHLLENFYSPQRSIWEEDLAKSGVCGRPFLSGSRAETGGQREALFRSHQTYCISGSGKLIPKGVGCHHSHPSFKKQTLDTQPAVANKCQIYPSPSFLAQVGCCRKKPASLKPLFWLWVDGKIRKGGELGTRWNKNDEWKPFSFKGFSREVVVSPRCPHPQPV